MAEKSCEGNNFTSKTIPTNEEIIEEVMKGVENCLIQKPNEDTPQSKDDSSANCFVPECNEQQTSKTCKNERLDESEDIKINGDNDTCELDDFIDELSLKDAEDTYSDEEKEQRRLEADTHKSKGNELFKSGAYRESLQKYTLGLRTCPLAFHKERSIMYSNRAAAKMKLDLKPTAIDDCSKAVELDPSYLKARYRRAQLYEETDKLDEALVDYQEVLKLDPLHQEALYAIKRLPEKIHERNEKMKADMMEKLKDLGNMILRPFNLSTDNFQVNQDPNTGGYSINFKPNSQE